MFNFSARKAVEGKFIVVKLLGPDFPVQFQINLFKQTFFKVQFYLNSGAMLINL